MMIFELLPNEILILCFAYLKPYEIFASFDQLNNRLNKLIRNIPFQLNFKDISKTLFDQYCQIIQSNREIIKQINCLHLSNENTCGQIQLFLSYFSLEEFSRLHSLKFSQIEVENISQLTSMLPFLSKLYSLDMISHKVDDKKIFEILPMCNLRMLSILSLHSLQTRIDETFNITNLTIFGCSLEHLFYHMFKYFPLLKSLKIQFLSKYNHPIGGEVMMNKSNGIYLKQLILTSFKYDFEDFQIFVKQIPNLRSLTINTHDDINMLNARKWKNLIQTSLLHLKIFKFHFAGRRQYSDETLLKFFSAFQEDFWCKEHQWYTEYSLEKRFASIYTIPYPSNRYQLQSNSQRFPNPLLNPCNTFDQVTSITFDHGIIADQCQYYFSNVNTLVLTTSGGNQTPMDIDYLKMMINLSNLTHLNVLHDKTIFTPSFLLEIFQQSPALSRLTMKSSDLIPVINDDHICQYLRKMIQILDIRKYPHSSFNSLEEIKKFCEIFSSLEQLTCSVMQVNDVFFLINHLSKLSTLDVHLPPLSDGDYLSHLFEEESRRLNFIFRVKGVGVKPPELLI